MGFPPGGSGENPQLEIKDLNVVIILVVTDFARS